MGLNPVINVLIKKKGNSDIETEKNAKGRQDWSDVPAPKNVKDCHQPPEESADLP